MLGLAALFYKAADYEELSMPVVWAGASCALYLAATSWLNWGLCGALSLQLGLFLWMGAWIALHEQRGGLSLGQLKATWYERQGRCRQCGYDLQGTPRPGRCPECGADVPPARAE